MLDQLKKAADQCAAHSGPVLPYIGTVHAARDLDVLRAALGDKKLNYLGFSYGTRLGAVYAAEFPHRVGRIALDGVDTLTEPLAEQGLAGAAGQQVALEDFVAWCVKDIACPFGTDARSARDEVVRLVRSLDEDPVPSDYGPPFTGQDLVAALSQALYSEEWWPSLERALSQLVENGDTSGVATFATGGMTLPVRSPRPTPGALVDEEDVPLDNLPAALMAINCADDPDRPAAGRIAADLRRLRTEYEQVSPVFGRYRLTQVLMCYGRPMRHRLHTRRGEARRHAEDAAGRHPRRPGDALPLDGGDRAAARSVGRGAGQQGRGAHGVRLVQVRAPQGGRLPDVRLAPAQRQLVPVRARGLSARQFRPLTNASRTAVSSAGFSTGSS